MKLNTVHTHIEKSDDFKTKKFEFDQSSKIFTMLSDTLYADKVGSIIRELSCNAVDSHIEANKKDIPFDVITPSRLDPTFKIRDYGVGISEEDMFKIYSSYGTSTKTNSNNYIGAFGLGSKTPFSYTKSFSVTSIYDGIKTLYTAYIDEEGFPALSKMGSIETDESNGFEVLFPVDISDINEFDTKARYILEDFDFPVKLNDVLIEREKQELVLSYKNIDVVNGYHDIYVKVGNIKYKVDRYKLKNTNYLNAMVFNNHDIVINLNIGEVELTVSREDISYTDHTINTIKKYCEIIAAKYEEKILEKYENIDNLYDRAVTINNDFYRSPKFLEKYSRFEIDISNYEHIRIGTVINGKFATCFRNGVIIKTYDIFERDYTDKNIYFYPKSRNCFSVFNKNTTLDTYGNSINNKLGRRNIILCVNDKDVDKARAEIKHFLKTIGNPKYDEPELIPISNKIKTQQIKIYTRKYSNCFELNSDYKTVDDVKKIKNPLVFHLYARETTDKNFDRSIHPSNILIHKLFNDGYTCIGVHKQYRKLIKDLPTIYDYYEEQKKKINENDYKEYLRYSTRNIQLNRWAKHIKKLVNSGESIDIILDNDLKKIINNKNHEINEKFDNFYLLRRMMNDSVGINKGEYIINLIGKMENNYPLLKTFSNYSYNDETIMELVNYINLKYRRTNFI